MDLALLGPLAVLALIDSTSFGTLLIPIWFLLAPGRLRPGRLLVFLGTVAAFYLVVGIALMSGATAFLESASGALDNPVAGVVQLALGAGLFIWSFFLGKKKPADRAGAGGAGYDGTSAQPGRMLRWRNRAMGADGAGVGPLIGLALGAATVEVASMLPYLGAIGLLTASDLATPQRVLVLTGYCLVMVLPALVLLGGRLVAGRVVEPVLQRIAAWMERTGAETTAWIVGIVGFLIARDALTRFPGILAFLDNLPTNG